MLDTLAVTLLLTIPTTTARWWIIPLENRSSWEESVAVSCLPGDPTSDIDSLRYYAIPTSGGPWRCVYAKGVRGRGGEPDSQAFLFPSWSGAHFYVTVVDTAGKEGCASNVVYKGAAVTGVPTTRPTPPSAVAVWYDVRGRRLAHAPRGTGLYFVRWYVAGRPRGRAVKVPVLEGRPVKPLRRPP